MSTIKRVFVIEQETPRLRLMQDINEAGVMDTIKKGVASVANKAVEWANRDSKPQETTPQETKASQPEKDEVDTFQTGDAKSRDITSIATQIMQTGTGSVRYVLSMTQPDLKKFYLKSGGGGDTVEMITALSQDKDNAFLNLAKNTTTEKIGIFVQIDGSHPSIVKSFKAAPKLNMMVLLNVPQNLAKEFSMAADENAAKESFVKMMSHKFYVGTLNRVKMGSNGAAILEKSAQDDGKIIKNFDPHWLEHWRDNAMRVRAVDAWDSVNSEDAQDKKMMKDAERLANKAAAVTSVKKSNSEIEAATSGKNDSTIKSIIANASDADTMATALAGGISTSKFSREDAIQAVTKMNDELSSVMSKLQVLGNDEKKKKKNR